MGALNFLLSARSLPPYTQVKLDLQALLFFSTWRLPFPEIMEAQHSPLSLTGRKPSFPNQKARTTDSPSEGKKAITYHSAGGTRSPVSPMYTEAHCFTLHLSAKESCISCPRAGISAPPLSGNPLLC
jgi:hypothetical protein